MLNLERTRLLTEKKKLREEKILLEANAKTDALIATLGLLNKEAQGKFWAVYSIVLTAEPYKSLFANINRRLEEIEKELIGDEPGPLC